MKKLIFLVIPAFIYAQNLKSLIEYAQLNNEIVVSSSLNQEAQSKNVDSKKSAYLPVIDVGAYYQRLDDRTPIMAGDVYSGYAKIGFDIYDGGRKSSLLEQAKNEYKSSKYDTDEMKKSLALEITEDFYTVKSLDASLRAKEDASKSLKEQLSRIKKYFEARLATKDDVDRLQSAYDTNIYEIKSLELQKLTALKSLELKVGTKIDTLDDSSFKEIKEDLQPIDAINSLLSKESALVSSAESIDSAYYPQIRLEDSYNLYGYGRSDAMHPEGLDNQNKILLSANIRLFDFGTLKEAKQAMIISAKALNSQVLYKTKEQKMHHEVALARLDTSKIKIQSAKSALIASESAFETIEKKYNAGIVDYVIYLDALTSKTRADALYETSLNELEIAYAMYYYYSGKNLAEYIK
ncbi:TolC family protein [Sulfurimonas sp.]|uniref:TolC family protein n=1 Tax=Sulfurimonas sp. TaxID=2022749 RepID=UPI00286E6037|nr:TolC family protein [Sulfurimonas sp.]